MQRIAQAVRQAAAYLAEFGQFRVYPTNLGSAADAEDGKVFCLVEAPSKEAAANNSSALETPRRKQVIMAAFSGSSKSAARIA